MGQVLVADDNPLSLAFFREAIGMTGHQVTTASDGNEAVAIAALGRFDLILLDARMPILDGPAALHSIRVGKGPSWQAPALATSADVGVLQPGLLDAGFEEVLIKPVGISDLRQLLVRYLGQADPRQAPALDDWLALEKAGGNGTIVAALRRLLGGELDALPAEIESYARDADRSALGDRLHRLEASAGFCGATLLAHAIGDLRASLDSGPAWPVSALSDFLRVCAHTRQVLL